MRQLGILKKYHYSASCKANLGNWNILVPKGKENNLVISLVVASEREKAQNIKVSALIWL